MSGRPTALVAEDEPLLRRALVRQLAQSWPELELVAEARNGREAVEQFEALQPQICFLDVHMPGLSGVEAAAFIGRRAHLVFVTAYDRYAVQAFQHGALDYLVKPVEPARLAETVRRLQERLASAQPVVDQQELLERLAAQLGPALGRALGRASGRAPEPPPLRWLRVSVGRAVRMVAIDELDYIRSEDKYTLIAWRGEAERPCEGLIRLPLKELLSQLDPQHFVQVHRAVVVNLRAVSHITRGEHDTAELHLRGRAETLPVSRSYLHLFRQM